MSGLMLLAVNAWAVDVSRLWLPRSQWVLEQDLILAAERAELTDRCAEVLSGKWLQSASTPERPVLIIICRDSITSRSYYRKYARLGPLRLELMEEQGRSMPSREIPRPVDAPEGDEPAGPEATLAQAEPDAAEMVEEPAEPELPPAELDAAEIEAIPLEDRVWADCSSALRKKTASMLDVVVHEDPRPEFRDPGTGGGSYTVDFDARNPRGDTLYYQAACDVSAEGATKLRLRPRPRPAEE